MAPRTLDPGRRTQIWLGGPTIADPELLYETDQTLYEAPNWTPDGSRLVINGDGALWTLSVDDPGAGPQRIDFDDLPDLNNDHVLAPDGEHVYMSAADRHIYRGTLTGGPVERVSPDDGNWHFLHGVSPDGTRLAYVEISDFDLPGRLAIIEPGQPATVLDTGNGHLDGPEWSPDGRWIYFNTQTFTDEPGHAQLARISDSGDTMERLVSSDTVDWFPHLSPDGTVASYIAFPPGTLGHPADKEVEIFVVSTADWSTPLQRYRLFGGQGTINVNSWAPDSTRFAFVGYPQA
ncbi:TolB family protein [Microlunatus soli]|uniref:WD40-like Beta Propeller Repeat n=1 Tax=Microlunatus soli TaxID=630515 RepID=A0A1H1P3J1_9ACTN|nr:PD40 domain-containing protein [Microlunatus soli]SDS05791.1 WD40-like Beta Propeller Repeat [Microlunatus soli]